MKHFFNLEKQKSDVSWTKQDGEFIPSPSTWLNQKQWENEYWFQVNSSVVAPDFSNANCNMETGNEYKHSKYDN
ncbi:hypothetical protein J595_02519 [Acinetobacter sp. 1592897]|nr:hypothetical protein J595_02519 [Acinetobacter sp. 1592897]